MVLEHEINSFNGPCLEWVVTLFILLSLGASGEVDLSNWTKHYG